MKCSIYIGYDQRERDAFAVAWHSTCAFLPPSIALHEIHLGGLQTFGLYTRPMYRRDGRLIDQLSIRDDYDGSISTEHANARFFVPHLAKLGWAMFMDGDMLVRHDMAPLFDSLDPKFALYCVKHDYEPDQHIKMDGQLQTQYPRKNWSSFMIFNCDHPANAALTLDVLNSWPGRDLHAFRWLPDELIGALDPAWNWLVGHSDPAINPKCVHFTQGTPDMPGYGHVPYADEWRAELARVRASHPEAIACRA